MDDVQGAARAVCRAWFKREPLGRVMSDLADQLARIDRGQTHGQANRKAGSGIADQGPRRGVGDHRSISAEIAGGHRQDREAQACD
jgi:hypothetical protein